MRDELITKRTGNFWDIEVSKWTSGTPERCHACNRPAAYHLSLHSLTTRLDYEHGACTSCVKAWLDLADDKE